MLSELMRITDIKAAQDLMMLNPNSYWVSDIGRAALALDHLVNATGGRNFFALKNLSILDLGCGCDPQYSQGRAPVLPIMASLYGAKPVVGIDQHPYTGQGREYYQHICFDLTQPTGFEEVTGHTGYHLVCCNTLIPALFALTIERARQVVRPDGIIIYNSERVT